MRANDGATTQAIPAPLRPRGACSRELPQPKFAPANRMSPGWKRSGHAGSLPLSTCLPRSSLVLSTRYGVGMIWSVSMSSPMNQALPLCHMGGYLLGVGSEIVRAAQLALDGAGSGDGRVAQVGLALHVALASGEVAVRGR